MAEDNQKYLLYHGRSSREFGAYINYPLNFVQANRDLSTTPINGVSGDYIEDNMRYQNISQTIVFTVIRDALLWKTWEEIEFAFYDWLKPKNVEHYTEYEPFYVELLNPFHYMAYLSAAPQWEITNQLKAQVTITLACKPYLVRGDEHFVDVPAKVHNYENINAHPLWHIVGSGAMTLNVNGTDYKLTTVDDEVYIDTTRFLVYKSLEENRIGNADFPDHDFPELVPGDNKIKLTGSYTKFEYKPNWRRLM